MPSGGSAGPSSSGASTPNSSRPQTPPPRSEIPSDPPTPPTPNLPLECPALQYGKDQSDHSQRQMETRYNRDKTTNVFQIGDVITVRIPPADDPSKGAPPRLFALVCDKRRNKYEVQTVAGIINTLLPAKELGPVNENLKNHYASDINASNCTKKVTLRHAARGGVTGPEYVFCNCKKMPCGAN